ncbi:MAG TPA: hypothetical protein VGC14_24250 [Rhizobium sp.]
MPYLVQAVLSAAGVFVALFVTRDTTAFPIYQFAVSLVFIVLAGVIVFYWPRMFKK